MRPTFSLLLLLLLPGHGDPAQVLRSCMHLN
jgi:hypothetical protein